MMTRHTRILWTSNADHLSIFFQRHSKHRVCLLTVLFVFVISILDGQSTTDKSSFEQGFDNWTVENNSWKRCNYSDLKTNYPQLPIPPSVNGSKIVIVPTNTSSGGLSVIHKDLFVPALTNLEVFFSCVVLGWKGDTDPMIRMNNPTLQVLYDDVLVFHLEAAISNSSGHYSNGNWNQFKLFSSYKTNFTMRISLMASNGIGKNNLVAVDNVIVRIISNSSRNHSKFGEEPETKIHEKNGTWDRIKTQSEEDEKSVEKNKTISYKPEFCDLLPEKGPCKGSWPRYFYNETTNKCEKFFYGGCNGNENNFHVKMACEVLCQTPNKTEDDGVFDIIFFGPPFLSPISSSRRRPSKNVTSLDLTFDDGFQDWTHDAWNLFSYDSNVGRNLNILPKNSSSTRGAAPQYRHNSLFKRPHIMHPIQLIPDANLTISFSLRLVGAINPILHLFFENVNPGFKIYIGDFLMFDYFISGEINNVWHSYNLNRSTNSILKFRHLTNNGSIYQIIRIESWQSSGGRAYLILDDLFINQTLLNVTKPPSAASTKPTTTTTLTTTKKSATTTTSDESKKTTSKSPKSTTTDSKSRSLAFPCYLPKSEGPCKMVSQRYFYDTSVLSCRPFNYSGCKGNANNFQSLSTCLSKCNDQRGSISSIKDICSLPFNEGNCRGFFERYYYDPDTLKCVTFVFTGCGGNGNNFNSKKDCLSTCAPSGKQDSKPVEFSTAFPRKLSDCKLPINTGNCDDRISMYGFDTVSSKCISFTYGGCGGNGNRFFSKSSCEKTCLARNSTSTVAPKNNTTKPTKSKILTCDPPVKVSCPNSSSTFYYYDKTSDSCKNDTGCKFKEGAGQFSSKKSCESLCKIGTKKLQPRDCILPPMEGSCNDKLKRFFYDPEEGKCLEFRYGGCRGNANNFKTVNDCESSCKGAEEKVLVGLLKSVCSLPKDRGPCSRNFKRYFYENATNTCKEFEYSGCGGNQNQFEMIEDCKVLCEKTSINENSSAFTIAESIIGVILIGLMALAVALGYKYYKIRKDRENYRIFMETQQRSGSVSSLAATIPNEAPIAYENPSFSFENDRDENNSIQLTTYRGETARRTDDGGIF